MDALIPILFAIVYFIFQAYTGYKKEQEKATKRNLGKPNPKVYPPSSEIPKAEYLRPVEPEYQKAHVPTYTEPVYESTYKQEKYVPSKRPVSLLDEYRRLASPEEDVVIRKAREARRVKRAGIKRLETAELDRESAVREQNRVHFDIREAIIMKAILERPYN